MDNLPSAKEILEKAQQLYMEDNGRFQDFLGVNLPERSELAEEGYLRRAQNILMAKQEPNAEKQSMDYVNSLKGEIEQIGFSVVLKPKPRQRRRKRQNTNKASARIVKKGTLEQFIRAGGYDVLKVAGVGAAAKVSGLSRATVHQIIMQHPPTEPYVRTNWRRRRVATDPKKSPRDWKAIPIRPQTLERFIKKGGYEVFNEQGTLAAAKVSGLSYVTIIRLLGHFPTKESAFEKETKNC